MMENFHYMSTLYCRLFFSNPNIVPATIHIKPEYAGTKPLSNKLRKLHLYSSFWVFLMHPLSYLFVNKAGDTATVEVTDTVISMRAYDDIKARKYSVLSKRIFCHL